MNPERYERDQAELGALRRAVFLVEVREAEAEFAAGEAPRYGASRPTRTTRSFRCTHLRLYRLKGELAAYWAFTVDDDLRVLVRWEGEDAFLVNLGSHDQVY